ncbi:hypothetical protein GN956_G26954, partial [Arapaima gigas]
MEANGYLGPERGGLELETPTERTRRREGRSGRRAGDVRSQGGRRASLRVRERGAEVTGTGRWRRKARKKASINSLREREEKE